MPRGSTGRPARKPDLPDRHHDTNYGGTWRGSVRRSCQPVSSPASPVDPANPAHVYTVWLLPALDPRWRRRHLRIRPTVDGRGAISRQPAGRPNDALADRLGQPRPRHGRQGSSSPRRRTRPRGVALPSDQLRRQPSRPVPGAAPSLLSSAGVGSGGSTSDDRAARWWTKAPADVCAVPHWSCRRSSLTGQSRRGKFVIVRECSRSRSRRMPRPSFVAPPSVSRGSNGRPLPYPCQSDSTFVVVS